MRRMILMLLMLCALLLSACGGSTTQQEVNASQPTEAIPEATPVQKPEAETVESAEPVTEERTELKLIIGDSEVSVQWEDNESVDALRELVANGPLTIQMSPYGGFEQVGSLGTSLPRSDVQTTTQAGDIVLYSGSNIVIFYGSNSWAYTRLGKIENLSAKELTDLLGDGDTTLTIFRD